MASPRPQRVRTTQAPTALASGPQSAGSNGTECTSTGAESKLGHQSIIDIINIVDRRMHIKLCPIACLLVAVVLVGWRAGATRRWLRLRQTL